jgi:ribosomal protein S18 acetylase RimI-like enzyme
MQNPLEIRSLGECSINELTEQWNLGFSQYFRDMTITPSAMIAKLGRWSIHPELSVAGYIEGVPAGFVLIGLHNVRGRKLAWDGGTGVNPAFRGMGLSKTLMQEAVRRARAEGAESLALETRVENEKAIRAYLGCGFKIVDTMHVMRLEGDFEHLPFRVADIALKRESAEEGSSTTATDTVTATATSIAPPGYTSVPSRLEVVSRLTFYQEAGNSWTTQWFTAASDQALIAVDPDSQPAGYAIFRKEYDQAGRLRSIQLGHCEADPARGDAPAVIAFLLGEVMEPLARGVNRRVQYMRERNVHALAALKEAGFRTHVAEHLMVCEL